MASVEGIAVAVERAVHDGLKAAIQKIATEHGIMVTDLRVEWHRQIGAPPQIGTLSVTTESGS